MNIGHRTKGFMPNGAVPYQPLPRSWGPASLLVIGLLSSCAIPITRMQVPRTVPPGRAQGAVGLALSQPADPTLTTDLAFRVGVLDRVDFGMRFRPQAFELGPKIELVRDAVEVSIAPAVLAGKEEPDPVFTEYQTASNTVSILAARASVYVGSNVDHRFAVFVAPTVDAGRRTFSADEKPHTAALLAPGVLSGMLFSPQQSVHLLLELGLLFPTGGAGQVGDGAFKEQLLFGPGDTRMEITVALVFGSFE